MSDRDRIIMLEHEVIRLKRYAMRGGLDVQDVNINQLNKKLDMLADHLGLRFSWQPPQGQSFKLIEKEVTDDSPPR